MAVDMWNVNVSAGVLRVQRDPLEWSSRQLGATGVDAVNGYWVLLTDEPFL